MTTHGRMADPDLETKIQALLREIRAWGVEAEATADALASRHGLPRFVVTRIAAQEGWDLNGPKSDQVDPNASTMDLDPDAIAEAVEEPKADDVGTGKWRKNRQTGEWELEQIQRKTEELDD